MHLQKKYHPIYQLPYCCVPATLQWIFYRNNLNILDQEFIGAKLGLTLPEKGRKLFSHPKIIFTDIKPKTGYGTQIEKNKYSINNFFKKNKIPLKISELYIFKNTSQLKNFLINNFNNETDIIIRYHLKLFNGSDCGHFAIITEFDTKKQTVVIGDPAMPFFQTVNMKDLIIAMSNKTDGIQRGLYLVKRITKNKP